jgi:acyl-lipid omega-6 desaturase (Delta-12 desaturase)
MVIYFKQPQLLSLDSYRYMLQTNDSYISVPNNALKGSSLNGSTPAHETSKNLATDDAKVGPEILKHLSGYQNSVAWRSAFEALTSVGPLVLLLVAMHYFFPISYLATFLLSIPASVFIIRVFIVQHDCGHGSFFESKRANTLMGWFCSLFTFFPYSYWRHQHALHHAGNGKLEDRGNGDVYLMTVKEYLNSTPLERIKYRLIRNPVTLFIFGPFVLFFVMNRFVYDKEHTPTSVCRGLYLSNVLMLASIGIAVALLGVAETAGIMLPIIFFSGLMGTILFYVQHQFEETYFESGKSWDYFEAAIKGSSFFDLPKILHWCTGNIGYHHVHHLAPKIPNYKLAECHESLPCFDAVKRETLSSFLKTFKLAFWDEQQRKLISLAELNARYL